MLACNFADVRATLRFLNGDGDTNLMHVYKQKIQPAAAAAATEGGCGHTDSRRKEEEEEGRRLHYMLISIHIDHTDIPIYNLGTDFLCVFIK